MGNLESGLHENTFIFLMVIGILIMLALALAFVIYANWSQKKLLTEQMRNQQLAYQHQEDLLHSTILTQEEERKRIARELHDEIGSKLNIIFLNLHRLQKISEEQEEMTGIMNEVNTLIHTTINTTRRISHDLLPPTLEDFGLVEAIKELQHNFHQAGNEGIYFELLSNEKPIENQVTELNLFRVLQELINNSLRHGQAAKIQIQLWLKTDAISLDYQDDGKGFIIDDAKIKKGLGLKNIESRLHMMQAQYQYHSAPGEGFKMSINIAHTKKIQNG